MEGPILNTEAIEQLTDGQRECLRLVREQYSSKEIAQRLNVGASAVDKRIERAVVTLGATSRFDAARMLAQAEGGYQRPPSDPTDIAPRTGPDDQGPWDAITPPSAPALPLPVRVPWTGLRRVSLIVALVLALCASVLVVLTVAERGSELWRSSRSIWP